MHFVSVPGFVFCKMHNICYFGKQKCVLQITVESKLYAVEGICIKQGVIGKMYLITSAKCSNKYTIENEHK